MTKYLTRSVIDKHFQLMSHQRADGRAQAGLQVQGKAASAAHGGVVGHNATMTIPTHARETSEIVSCFSEMRDSDIRGTPNRGASPSAHPRSGFLNSPVHRGRKGKTKLQALSFRTPPESHARCRLDWVRTARWAEEEYEEIHPIIRLAHDGDGQSCRALIFNSCP